MRHYNNFKHLSLFLAHSILTEILANW